MPGNRWISDLHWVRQGQQSRSQKTQEALLGAAESLFSEKGVEATSVAEIAERAGLSVGAVYHHFRDKKTLLYALFERMVEQIRATIPVAVDPARWEGATVADILQGYIEFVLDGGRTRAGFKRVALEAARDDARMREELADLHRAVDRGLTRLLLARRREIGHPEPQLAVGFVLDQLSAMLAVRTHEVLAPTRLRSRSNRVFALEALRSACAYLQVGLPEQW